MSYHAFLTVVDQRLASLSLTVTAVTNEIIQLDVSGRALALTLPFGDSQQAVRLGAARERLAVSANLLGREPVEDEDEAVGWLLLEDLMSRRISACWFESDAVAGQMGGRVIRWPLVEVRDYKSLYAAKLVRDGYQLKEDPGLGVLVTSPAGVTSFATPFECSCQTTRREKFCKHKCLVEQLVKRREAFSPISTQ